ncbi:kinase-like domain-containing protein [Gigaspora rosea]|uniref:Kinase-like domain-containing protein n=1 Tax=Gigaspora rosea TaxID=44941 RepID=A0A397W8K0_9GLOM|nr:kinase-like domain-containing protein [Gigaspora rosea]
MKWYEWVPFEKLDNILKVSEELSGPIFSATWKDGIRIIEGDHDNITRTRTRPCGVILETLDDSQLESFEVFEKHMQSYDNHELKIYGITRNSAINSYFVVIDKFYSNRNSCYGSCPDCKKYNNSDVWCLTCDTQKMTQGWSSENKDIDDCIKEFQIKATKYTDVIEWVPFNKLTVKDEGIEDKTKSKYEATWSEGIRIIGGDENKGYEQSRAPSYPVYLLLLSQTNASDFINQLGSKRDSKYRICDDCRRYRHSQLWCLSCDPHKEERPDIENDEISSLIVSFQHRAMSYEDVIEWIPFKNLVHIKELGKGGFGAVFSATWISGIRKLKNNEKSRVYLNKVAIKTLSSISEFKNHMDCRLKGISLDVYGLTQQADKYLMVYQYANKGNLHEYLRSNFGDLLWENKLKLLENISKDLALIHEAGYVHADFHSGNILLNQHIDEDLKSLKCYISNLGLSINKNSFDFLKYIPYVAPEILRGERQKTQVADIYGFGAIMSEMSTGQRPFDGHDFDDKLVTKICNGLRPEFACGTPDCYIGLARQCMNPDPDKRPTA